MKPPYFLESGRESDEKRVIIAKVSLEATLPPGPRFTSESDEKSSKSDGIMVKLEHFLGHFCQEYQEMALLAP